MTVGHGEPAGDYGGDRVLDGAISTYERGLLENLARRLPLWMRPDQLTVLGVLGSVLAAVGLVASHLSLMFLWLAVLGLLLNWLGDSLDGTLARVRRIQRPRYGFFVDHVSDIASQFLLVLGLGLSPLMRFDIALLALLGYLALSTYTYIKLHVTRSMQLTYFGIGPTEIRVLIGAGLVLATIVDLPWTATSFGRIGLFDAVGLILFFFALVSGAAMFVRDARQLALVDPVKRVAPTEVRVTGIEPPITAGLAVPETAGHAVH
jgi:archaetidylinositol phosphate synthase